LQLASSTESKYGVAKVESIRLELIHRYRRLRVMIKTLR